MSKTAKKYTGKPRGFAVMDPDRLRELAIKGGRASQAQGVGHRWTPEEAAAAGRVGGRISRGGRGRIDTTQDSAA